MKKERLDKIRSFGLKCRRIALQLSGGFVLSIALALLYYILWSSVFLTDEQKRLEQENKLLREAIPQVQAKVDLLSDEMHFLKGRDENIYKQVFKSDAPMVTSMLENPLLGNADVGDDVLARRTSEHSAGLVARSDSVELVWRAIFDTLASRKSSCPPLVTPVKGLTHTNIGASVGKVMNPFYKLRVRHEGLDIIAPSGTPVYATASGYVTEVKTSRGGKGNMVEITHSGGYKTRYAHLSEAVVKKGRYIKAGTLVGYVGDSGRSFATHLHYELHRDTLALDPVHYLFGSIGPQEYIKMQIMSLSSGQSMD